MRPPHVQAFIDRVLPFARRACAETGLPVSLILAQWATESAWGRSDLARRNNLGSIAGRGGMRSYPDLEAFRKDYVRVINLSYYDEVRRTAAQGGDPLAVAQALGRSPYSESHYADRANRPGGYLAQVMSDFNLREYDTAGE